MPSVIHGLSREVIITPTITASSAYASGNALGGLLTITNAALQGQGTSTIQSITLTDIDNQKSAIDLYLSEVTFTATTDKTAFALSAADVLNSAGWVSIAASDYITFGARAVANQKNIGLSFDLNQYATSTYGAAIQPTTLYGQLVCRGTPTYTTTTSLRLKIVFFQD
jgi:hypothetical protein